MQVATLGGEALTSSGEVEVIENRLQAISWLVSVGTGFATFSGVGNPTRGSKKYLPEFDSSSPEGS